MERKKATVLKIGQTGISIKAGFQKDLTMEWGIGKSKIRSNTWVNGEMITWRDMGSITT